MTHFALGFGVLMLGIGIAVGNRCGYQRCRDAYIRAAMRRVQQQQRENAR